MSIWLKEATASQEVPLGYFLDSGDGDAEETGLTIANTDIKLWKTGATALANKNSGGATHISNGIYYVTLDATDTNTLGPMVIFVHVAGALSIKEHCLVVPANVWDALFGSDKLQVDVREFGDSNLALTTQMKADVNAEADTALDDQDLPSNTEFEARTLAAASYATAAALATVDGNVDSILADTNELQGDWANGGRLDLLLDARASQSSVDDLPTNSELTAALADLPTKAELDAAQASVTVTTNNDKTGYALTSGEHNNIADALLKRDWTAITGEAARSALNALRSLRNRLSISGNTLTVMQEDDTTSAWTATVETDADAEPVTGVDPT